MLLMKPDEKESLIKDITEIFCKYNPIKGEVELYRTINQASDLGGFGLPYQNPARDISDRLGGFVTIDALQLFIYKRMLGYEYTTNLEYMNYYLGEDVDEDQEEFFSRVCERELPGKAGHLEDYEGIAKEIFSLKVKYFVKTGSV